MNHEIGDVCTDSIGKYLVAIRENNDHSMVWIVLGVKKPQLVPEQHAIEIEKSGDGLVFSDNRITLRTHNQMYWLHYQFASLKAVVLTSSHQLNRIGWSFPADVDKLLSLCAISDNPESWKVPVITAHDLGSPNVSATKIRTEKDIHQVGKVYQGHNGDYLVVVRVTKNEIYWYKVFEKNQWPSTLLQLVPKYKGISPVSAFYYANHEKHIVKTSRLANFSYINTISKGYLRPLITFVDQTIGKEMATQQNTPRQKHKVGDVCERFDGQVLLAIRVEPKQVVWQVLSLNKSIQALYLLNVQLPNGQTRVFYYGNTRQITISINDHQNLEYFGNASPEDAANVAIVKALCVEKHKVELAKQREAEKLKKLQKQLQTKAAEKQKSQKQASSPLRNLDPLEKLDLVKRRWAYISYESQVRPRPEPLQQLTHEIINIQQVVELVKQYPGIADDLMGDDLLPFDACTFLFKDDRGQAIVVSGSNTENGVHFESLSGIDYELACRLAVSLMNCKNISYEDYDPNHYADQGNRTDQPFIRYKILMINAPGSRRSREPSSSHTHGQRPARAVRGHYKIGTPEKPLFGKPWGIGRFWCGPYVTGNPKFGLVIKDYQIELKSLKELLARES